jgi:uncharacterized membrane protein
MEPPINAAHFHLLVNHLPILGSLFALLIVAAGYISKQEMIRRTGLGLLFFAGLTGIPALFSGEPAEEMIEHLPGISHDLIKAHAKAANIAFYTLLVAAIAAAATLYLKWKNHALAKPLELVALVVGIAAFALMARAGTTGGVIRHPEINGAIAPAPSHQDDSHE